MFALLRLSIIGFFVLSLIFLVLSVWSRRTRRAKLNAQWDEEQMSGDRDAWIDEGLVDYDHSLRRKLILGVYVVPVAVISTIVYLTNF